MTAADLAAHPGPGFAHLTICVSASGEVRFYPKGDPDVLYRGLGLAVKALYEHPETLRCAVGGCDGGCGHAIRRN